MRRRIAIAALVIAAFTVGTTGVADAVPSRTSATAPAFCMDLFGIGICVPALV